MTDRLVLIAAGGTGGHLFPAESLGIALRKLGVRVVLATDERVGEIAAAFPAEEIVEIPSGTPSGGSVGRKGLAALQLARGVLHALRLVRRLKPDCVVGFGGYPTVPPLLAASLLRVPTIIHEQNGVIGRANRFLMNRVSAIATGFATVKGLPEHFGPKVYHTGNPLRPPVLAAARLPVPELRPGGVFRLLAFGGSQGARIMSEVVPEGLASLPVEARARLAVVQQARPEDVDGVRETYRKAGISADVAPFFKDLPARIAAAQLVVARSGASTVAELAAIGRASILVPLPGALDQDQAANARSLTEIGAATVISQGEFTRERLAAEVLARLDNPLALTEAAEAAKSVGVLDSAERLAALVLSLAKIPVPDGRVQETPA